MSKYGQSLGDEDAHVQDVDVRAFSDVVGDEPRAFYTAQQGDAFSVIHARGGALIEDVCKWFEKSSPRDTVLQPVSETEAQTRWNELASATYRPTFEGSTWFVFQ